MKKYELLLLSVILIGLTSSVACADTIYVTNSSNNTVAIIGSGGTTTTFGSSSDLSGPTGLAMNSSGDIFVANNNSGDIAEFTPSVAGYVFEDDFATGLSNPRGLAFDSAGNLYVANQSDGIVDKFTPGGVESVFATGLSTPNGLAFDSAGNLFVTNGTGGTGAGSITLITPGGIPANLTISGTPLNAPNGIAFKGNNVYVVDHNDPAVEEITSGGVGSIFPTTAGSLNLPKTLTFDSSGNLYVTDFGNNTVTEYNASGALIHTYSTDIDGPCFVIAVASLSVPEPSTYALLGLGAGLLFFFNRRKLARA